MVAWRENFENGLHQYRVPLFMLTTATFFILLARVFTVTSAALSIATAFFILGSLNLLAAGVSAAYSIVRYEQAMSLGVWWHEASRATRNCVVIVIFDVILLAGYLLTIPGVRTLWEILVTYLPNVYEPVFLQTIAMVRDASPGSRVASGIGLTVTTELLMVLTVHCLVAYTVGFLLQKTKDSRGWGVVNYGVLALVLATLHFFLLFRGVFI